MELMKKMTLTWKEKRDKKLLADCRKAMGWKKKTPTVEDVKKWLNCSFDNRATRNMYRNLKTVEKLKV